MISALLLAAALLVPAPRPHVVFVTGDCEYRSEVSMPMLASILEESHGFRCTVLYATAPDGTKDPKHRQSIPGLEALRDADLAVFFMRFRALPDTQLKEILDYAASGRPLMGFRTTTHAFLYEGGPNAKWNDGFGIEVFGQKWITHHGHTSTTAVSVIGAEKDHPILRGVKPEFPAASWLYHVDPLVGDCRPLLRGRAVNSEQTKAFDKFPPEQPVAWTKTHGQARVFFTTLGHPLDFAEESMRRLAVNAVFWALGREAEIPATGLAANPKARYEAPPTH